MDWLILSAGSVDDHLAVNERATVGLKGKNLRGHALVPLRYRSCSDQNSWLNTCIAGLWLLSRLDAFNCSREMFVCNWG